MKPRRRVTPPTSLRSLSGAKALGLTPDPPAPRSSQHHSHLAPTPAPPSPHFRIPLRPPASPSGFQRWKTQPGTRVSLRRETCGSSPWAGRQRAPIARVTTQYYAAAVSLAKSCGGGPGDVTSGTCASSRRRPEVALAPSGGGEESRRMFSESPGLAP